MGERPTVVDKPASEAIATTGLFLNVASVIAIAVCIAGWGASDAAWAATAGVVAFLTFTASLVCFGKQAGDGDPQPVSG